MTGFIDWLSATFLEWARWVQGLIAELLGWFEDVFLTVFDYLIQGIVYVFALLEPPEFLTIGLGSLFNSFPDDLKYFLSQSGLAAGLAIYGAGVSFRLLRKLFTLGQW